MVEAAGLLVAGKVTSGADAVAGVEDVVLEAAGVLDVELAWALVVDVLEESSELQPPRAANNATHTNPAHALSAPTLCTMVTYSHCYVKTRNTGDHGHKQSHKGNMQLPPATPLSAACRPEALRPRLATGLPLNDSQ
jgi:hypothetical protein